MTNQRPVSSYVMQRPMTKRDWAMAMCAFAAMGLTACVNVVNAIDDAASTQVQKITGPEKTCTDTYTLDMQTGHTDTTTVCEVK